MNETPTWLRILQAVLFGVVAGFLLHAVLSIVVLQGQTDGAGPRGSGAAECQKTLPHRGSTPTSG